MRIEDMKKILPSSIDFAKSILGTLESKSTELREEKTMLVTAAKALVERYESIESTLARTEGFPDSIEKKEASALLDIFSGLEKMAPELLISVQKL